MRLKKLQDYKVNNSERIKKEEIPFLKYLNKLYLVKSEKGDYINLEPTTFIALHEALKQLKIDKADIFLIKEKDIVVPTAEGTFINPFENYRQEYENLETKDNQEFDNSFKEVINELPDEEKEAEKKLIHTNEYYQITKSDVPPVFNRNHWSKRQRKVTNYKPFQWQVIEQEFSDGTQEISGPILVSRGDNEEVTEEVEPNEAKNLHGDRPEHE